MTDKPFASAAVLAAGIAIAGFLVGHGFSVGRSADRYVTVKGIAEREVRADLALWPLRVVVGDNDLRAANQRLSQQLRQIKVFLAQNDVDTTAIGLQDFSVSDAYANQFRTEQVATRYVLKQTLMVRSNAPDKVLAASQKVGDLVSAGIVFVSGEEYGNGGPTFVFTGLNGLKPRMIAEATGRARESATQFATDSHSSLGGIRTANQGVFEILPRDQAPGVQEAAQITKTVRVVSTVEYFLK